MVRLPAAPTLRPQRGHRMAALVPASQRPEQMGRQRVGQRLHLTDSSCLPQLQSASLRLHSPCCHRIQCLGQQERVHWRQLKSIITPLHPFQSLMRSAQANLLLQAQQLTSERLLRVMHAAPTCQHRVGHACLMRCGYRPQPQHPLASQMLPVRPRHLPARFLNVRQHLQCPHSCRAVWRVDCAPAWDASAGPTPQSAQCSESTAARRSSAPLL